MASPLIWASFISFFQLDPLNGFLVGFFLVLSFSHFLSAMQPKWPCCLSEYLMITVLLAYELQWFPIVSGIRSRLFSVAPKALLSPIPFCPSTSSSSSSDILHWFLFHPFSSITPLYTLFILQNISCAHLSCSIFLCAAHSRVLLLHTWNNHRVLKFRSICDLLCSDSFILLTETLRPRRVKWHLRSQHWWHSREWDSCPWLQGMILSISSPPGCPYWYCSLPSCLCCLCFTLSPVTFFFKAPFWWGYSSAQKVTMAPAASHINSRIRLVSKRLHSLSLSSPFISQKVPSMEVRQIISIILLNLRCHQL